MIEHIQYLVSKNYIFIICVKFAYSSSSMVYVVHNDCSFLLDTRTIRVSSSTRTCYECALKKFKELAYQFRQDISSDDLPGKCVIVECTYTLY